MHHTCGGGSGKSTGMPDTVDATGRQGESSSSSPSLSLGKSLAQAGLLCPLGSIPLPQGMRVFCSLSLTSLQDSGSFSPRGLILGEGRDHNSAWHLAENPALFASLLGDVTYCWRAVLFIASAAAAREGSWLAGRQRRAVQLSFQGSSSPTFMGYPHPTPVLRGR